MIQNNAHKIASNITICILIIIIAPSVIKSCNKEHQRTALKNEEIYAQNPNRNQVRNQLKNIYSPNRWYTNDGVSYPLSKNIYREYYIDFFKQKLFDKDIKNIFTILPIDQKSFDFIFKSNCIKSISINKILFKHELLNCFER